ncbi:MAG: GAF domain-containing protein [Anaerolineae bacterium]|jgi:GAF domain-containing protein|nr:GAF domain-containing protein [Anaerolineae bacterium]
MTLSPAAPIIRRTTEDSIHQLRVGYVRFILLAVVFGSSVVLALLLLSVGSDARRIASSSATIGMALLALLALRSPRLDRLVLNMMGLLVLAFTFFSSESLTLLALMSLSGISGAILLGRTGFGLVIVGLAARAALYTAGLESDFFGAGVNSFLTIVEWLLVCVFPLLISFLMRYIVERLQETVIRAGRTAQLLEATASTGQVMSQLLNMNDLLSRSVELIRDRFGFYHVQIFMLDERGAYVVLAASTGEIGQRLLARGYRLPVNSQSLIGRVVQAGEAIITRNSEIAGAAADADLLPRTRSELGLPVRDGDSVIGALDVHSMRVSAFNPVEVQALQVMTGQLATAIRNARLFQAQEASLRENKRLFVEAETSLRENQRLNRQLTRQAWGEYLTAQRSISGVTLDQTRFQPGAAWTAQMQEASQRRRAITRSTADASLIAVPIELRGEVIGAIEIETPGGVHNEETVDMLQAVAGRLAISVDNARLFEETQEATAQEQGVSQIVSQYQSAVTVDDLLQITLQGLYETLGAEAASVRMALPPSPDAPAGAPDSTNGSSGTNGTHGVKA